MHVYGLCIKGTTSGRTVELQDIQSVSSGYAEFFILIFELINFVNFFETYTTENSSVFLFFYIIFKVFTKQAPLLLSGC